eukprot:CAMPEP_0203866990 /NCGR_PEP_ID=MMETSP0359-20131031/16265_1 /ASSEMBLY_ACC=CAM_ASM_000338 /TAXON_ID=268821 /ORGANISM="Scrippsiella Hangoei, Strain SHTV-5" /LENGTH=189 /DNA_ID=CAMNT_0050785167 /DNA_START=34 /DNA_END=601 /DNA_ORIENTATION=-
MRHDELLYTCVHANVLSRGRDTRAPAEICRKTPLIIRTTHRPNRAEQGIQAPTRKPTYRPPPVTRRTRDITTAYGFWTFSRMNVLRPPLIPITAKAKVAAVGQRCTADSDEKLRTLANGSLVGGIKAAVGLVGQEEGAGGLQVLGIVVTVVLVVAAINRGFPSSTTAAAHLPNADGVGAKADSEGPLNH